MASLLKPTRPYPLPPDAEIVTKDGRRHVRVKQPGGKAALYPLSRDGTKYLRPSGKWYGQIRGADGKVRRVPLCRDKAAAAVMLAELSRRVEMERIGVRDPHAAHTGRPLLEHLGEWVDGMRAKRRDEKHVATQANRVRLILNECGFVFPGDLAADRLELFLGRLREPDAAPAIPPSPWFTKAEAAAVLGVTPGNFRSLVRRHRLAAAGNGKARLFPRATVQAIADLRAAGNSTSTANAYLTAVRTFTRWLADHHRIPRDPFTSVKPGNAAADVRRRRGELSAAECETLLDATLKSRGTWRGLTGRDRHAIYLTAMNTGYRADELASLTAVSFDLAAAPPVVVLAAEFTKNGKAAVQPIPAAVAAELKTYLKGRPKGRPVWPGAWSEKAADMLRNDLDEAGVAFLADGPEGPEHRDFHAIRGIYVSNVIRAGADLKVAMTLARHSDPKLTAKVYARVRMADLANVVERLPGAKPGGNNSGAEGRPS